MLGGQISTIAAGLRNTTLTPRARLVLLSVATCCDRAGWGPPIPLKIGSLCERCGLSRHSLRRSFKELEQLIEVFKIKDDESGQYIGIRFQINPECFPVAQGQRQIGAPIAEDAPKDQKPSAKLEGLSLLYTPKREPRRIPQSVLDSLRVRIQKREGDRRAG